MPWDRIEKAEDFDLSINSDGHAILKETMFESEFGKNHGGKARVVLPNSIISSAAVICMVAVAVWLGGTTMSDASKAIIAVGTLGSFVAAEIVICCLYFRLRYVLAILAVLAVGAGVTVALLALLF